MAETILTVLQAANILNVSCSYFEKLLEDGKIEFIGIGSYRRVRHQDLLAYMKQADESSRKALDELTEQAQALKMGY